ncbi:MAG: CNNM domain-containing protein [Phycisphaerae bacterium]|nr:CNNM domain-containing protein [Phycisphaerae bacterium]
MEFAVLPWILFALLGVGLSALFSGMEIGIYTLNRIGLAVRVGRGERSAVILDAELSRMDRVLATLLIGNNVANYVAGLGIAAVLEIYHVGVVAAVVINTCVLLPVTFVLGETLPKDLFRTYTDVWTYTFSRYLRGWRWLLTAVLLVPVVGAISNRVRDSFHSDDSATAVDPRQRISQLIREGVNAGVLSEEQTTLADRALRLRGLSVASEMTPWSRVTTIPLDATSQARAAILQRSTSSRLPVVDRTGRVVGVLNALDAILDPGVATVSLMSLPMVFGSTDSALVALRMMRVKRTRLAIVADSSGVPVGVVALKDLIEPVTGNLIGS